MNFSTACPSCGAALDITEQTARVVCPFCGNQFDLDLSAANPDFHKSAPRADSADVIVPDDADIITPPDSSPESTNSYSPPPPDVFSPAPDQTFNLPFIAQAAGRLVNPRLWIALAIATIVIFCVSCLCLLAVVQMILRAAAQ